MKKVVLHGELKKYWDGPELWFDVETPLEAIKAFVSQTGTFQPVLGQPSYPVVAVGFEDAISLTSPTDAEEIHLVPDFAGGKSAFLMIAVGALLVASAFIPGLNVMVAGFAFSLGASLMLGGISQLLAPVPKREGTSKTDEGSKYFGAPENTVASGTPIPIVYGRQRIYGHYLSVNVDAKDVKTN